jgi:translocator protein
MAWVGISPRTIRQTFEPPGYVIGLVWEGLFALMATSRWLLNASSEIGAVRSRTWITVLIGFCLLWAFYSLAISNLIGGLLGNLGAILLSVVTITRVWRYSKPAAFLILPVSLWVIFATAIVLSQLGWFVEKP